MNISFYVNEIILHRQRKEERPSRWTETQSQLTRRYNKQCVTRIGYSWRIIDKSVETTCTDARRKTVWPTFRLAHWLPANFPEEPITLRTNQASLERHQVKLLRPIFSLSPRLPSRFSQSAFLTMAIHPLCEIRLALAVRRRLENRSGQRGVYSRWGRIANSRKEREKEREIEGKSSQFQRHRSGIRQCGSHSSHPANSYEANTRNSLWIITKIPDILA